MFEHASNLNGRKRHCEGKRQRERERDHPTPNPYPVMARTVIKFSFFGLLYSLIICVILFLECHIMCFWTCAREGVKAGGWLNNENSLRGNEELRLSISEV